MKHSSTSTHFKDRATFKFQANNDDLDKLLRFEGGDVLVALGPHAHDHLILHSSVLKAASPVFEAGLRGDWDTSKMVSKPDAQQSVEVVRYSLVLHDGIFALQVKVSKR